MSAVTMAMAIPSGMPLVYPIAAFIAMVDHLVFPLPLPLVLVVIGRAQEVVGPEAKSFEGRKRWGRE